MEHGDLNHIEIQALIEYVNTEVQEENDCKEKLKKKSFQFSFWWKHCFHFFILSE